MFEMHITLDISQAVAASRIGEELNWHCSQIHGDPAMGKKPFFYLTRHENTFPQALECLNYSQSALEAAGIPLLRKKIEAVLLDVRL